MIPEVEVCGGRVVDQLVRRVCFSIAVNNTDDHLRNHGFLFKDGSWHISPCFDVTCNPQLSSRQTPVLSGVGDEVAELVELAKVFDMSDKAVESVFADIAGVLGEFDLAARRNKVPPKTLSLVAPVLERGIGLLVR